MARWRRCMATAGLITTDFGGDDEATSLAIQPADGRILLAGYSTQNGNDSFAIARYSR